jgi:hypothetical protein
MANENLDLTAAFIADIEKKIAALQAILLSLKSASAIGALGAAVEGGDLSIPLSNGDLGQPVDLPEGAFLGKSVPACIKLYLSTARRKKSVKEITIALREGGVESTSGKFENIVTSSLNRLKGAGEVLRFKDGWGLTEWYPANMRAVNPAATSKRSKKKSSRRVRAEKVIPSILAREGVPPMPSQKANVRALEFLRSGKKAEYGLMDVGSYLGMGSQGARLILGKLVRAGKVEKTANATYRIPQPKLVAASV